MSKKIGIINMIYSVIFTFLVSVSALFIEDATNRFPLWFSIFFNALIMIIIFNALNLGAIRKTYCSCLKHKGAVFLLMLVSLMIYVCCFFSTNLIGGSPYNSFYFAGSGFLGFTFAKLTSQYRTHRLTALCLAILIFSYIAYRSITIGPFMNEILGSTLALTGSFCGYVYSLISCKLAETQEFSSLQILSFRFYFLLVFSFFLLPEDTMELISMESMFYMVLLSISGMVFPVYFLQKGIHAVGAELNAIVIAFVPFITLTFTTFFNQKVNFRESFFVLVLTVFLMLPYSVVFLRKIRKGEA